MYNGWRRLPGVAPLGFCIEDSGLFVFDLTTNTSCCASMSSEEGRRSIKLVSVGGYGDDGHVGVFAADVALHVRCNNKDGYSTVEPDEGTLYAQWAEVPTPPELVVEGHTCTRTSALSGLVFGGLNEDYEHTNALHRVTAVDGRLEFELNIATGGIAPAARYRHSACLLSGPSSLVVFGGEDTASPRNDLHVLDLATMVWREVAWHPRQPTPTRRFLACAVPGGEHGTLIIHGGTTVADGGTHVPCDDVMWHVQLQDDGADGIVAVASVVGVAAAGTPVVTSDDAVRCPRNGHAVVSTGLTTPRTANTVVVFGGKGPWHENDGDDCVHVMVAVNSEHNDYSVVTTQPLLRPSTGTSMVCGNDSPHWVYMPATDSVVVAGGAEGLRFVWFLIGGDRRHPPNDEIEGNALGGTVYMCDVVVCS
eukprot:PhM_4_TR3527/c0_g1_i1/m.16738